MRRTDLPIELGPVSNGEYAPPPTGPVAREAARRALAAVDEGARRTGMSRRRFLQLCGTATVLSALAACSREQAAVQGTTTTTTSSTSSTTTTSTAPGGTFEVPDEATVEPEAAEEALDGQEFVVDVQTHLLEFDLDTPAGGFFGGGFPQASCGLDDPRSCFSIDQWIALVLEQSDTAVAVLSAVPIVDDPSPLSTEVMERARREAEAVGCDGRVLLQGEAFPTTGEPEAVFDGMAALATDHDIVAWKTYTHVGTGWYLDDHDPDAAQVGQRFLDQVRELGTPMVAVHKGFGNNRFASPVDIGPAAAANPDLSFLVYHSGYQPGVAEGAYDPAAPNAGIDRLLASVEGAGIGPGGNVYAELGSTWFNVLRDPTEAAHVIGKLLATFGPERILWGTDSIWYGSPQSQIEAFRAFQISPELQERHGYPALTDEVKSLILGGNAARLHGIEAPTCAPTTPSDESAAPNRALGPATAAEAREVFSAHHPWWSTTPV
ncbi:MAG: amidohydrolase family protein [Actinomycetota bacterium]